MIGTGWNRIYHADSRGFFQLTFLTGTNTYLVTCTAPNRVPKDLLLDVDGAALLMKDIELLTPEEFSAQNPSVPLAYGGMLEALGAIDAHNQGVALFISGSFKEALPFLESAGRQLEKALAQGLAPAVQTDFRARLSGIQRLHGCALAEMGKLDPAKRSLLFAQSEPLLWKALEGNTSDTVVYLHLVEILKARKDTAALAKIDKIYINKSPVVPFNHGVEAFNEGQVEMAAQFFQSTLTLDPRFAEAHYLLARCEWELGRTQASRSHLLEYLKLSPEGENAKKARAMLSKTPAH
ncbi:MAG: tetratricopeptide repeat protein [Holophaga sp.]|nr:tetratricopeptide repeat protein [Holophaga sp.]